MYAEQIQHLRDMNGLARPQVRLGLCRVYGIDCEKALICKQSL